MKPEKVLPSTSEKFLKNEKSRTVYLQHHNAKSHLTNNDTVLQKVVVCS